MNSSLLLLLCNLAFALGASVNHQTPGLSARASRPLAPTSDGLGLLKKRQGSTPPANTLTPDDNAENMELPTVDASKDRQTSNGFERAQASLQDHFAQLKKSMDQLQKSFSNHTGDEGKVEFENLFANAKVSMSIINAYSGDLSSVTGIKQEYLDTFFSHVGQSLSELHTSLLNNSDNMLTQLREFFAQLIESISELHSTSENTTAKAVQVTGFLTNAVQLISNLEAAFEQTHAVSDIQVELKVFFGELAASLANLETEMGEGGAKSK